MTTGTTAVRHGPSGMRVMRYWGQLIRDPLATYCALQRDYGDAVPVLVPPRLKHTFHLLNRPEYAEHVLVQHQDRYARPFTYRPLRAYFGSGLLTAEGALWQRHRRLVQPVFSHRHIQSFAPAIVTAARKRFGQWTSGSTIDIASEMQALTMNVIGRVLFGADMARDAESVGRAVTRVQRSLAVAAVLPPSWSPERVRAVAARVVPGLGHASKTLESVIARIIDARIGAPHDEPSALLDLLLAAGADQEPLSRTEIHDEVLTLICAGYETTANALTWALTLLSRYPAARERLVAEVDEVLGGRDPQASDIDALPWTKAVMSESMRLYPPVWRIERDAVQADDIMGIRVCVGDTVGFSPYLLHRHPEFWSNPDQFDPQRFLADRPSAPARYAYLPFGAGRRICVGAGLAQMETTLALAVLAQSARVDLVTPAPPPIRAAVTLHPAGPVLATVSR